jgi:hypothetical protein
MPRQTACARVRSFVSSHSFFERRRGRAARFSSSITPVARLFFHHRSSFLSRSSFIASAAASIRYQK